MTDPNMAHDESKRTERGAGLAEYALLLLLVALVCIGALTVLGTTVSGVLNTATGMF